MRLVTLFSVAALSVLGLTGCEKKLAKPVPDTVAVTLAPADVSADQGVTSASALVTDNRIPLERISVRFQIALVAATGANPTYAEILAETDVNGIASADLTGLQQTGAGEVIATAMREESAGVFVPRLDESDAPIAGSAALRVLPGVATSMAVSLNPTAVNPANGDFTDVSWVVRDAQGNRTADSVEIVTDHPGATVLGARLENLGLAGSWSVAVSVTGRPQVSDAENFTVLPGTAQMIDTLLSNATTDAYADPLLHPPVAVSYKVTDASGNDVTFGANVVCGIDVLSGGGIAAGVISPLVIKGTFPVTCSLLDGANALVSKDTETLTVVDLTPPAVAITSPVAGATFLADQTFTVQVRGQDLVGVTQLTAQLVGLGDNTFQSHLVAISANKDVTAPLLFTAANNQNSFGGTQTIYALGYDGSGNTATAPSVTINVQPFSVLGAGITARLVRQDVAIVNPRAIAADPQSPATNPVLFVADNGGGGAIHRIVYDRAAGTSTRTAFATGSNFRGVEWDAAGNLLYATADDTIRVYDRTGALVRTLTIAGAATLEHLTFGPGGFLYAADSNNIRIFRIINLLTGLSTIFADSGTARSGGGQSLDQPMGIGYAPVLTLSSNLFVSDVSRDIVYELQPDANLDGATDRMSVFMARNIPALGPNPDVVYGVEYKRAGGAFGDQLFVANNGNDRVLAAVRDNAIVNDADLLSDQWSTFLASVGRAPIDMGFHVGGRMYVLFDQGNGMDPHVVELSGF